MSFVCSICGERHDGLQAIGYVKPQHWLDLSADQQARGKIDSDLCATVDGHFFVRAVLEVPIIGGPEPTLEFGPWTSLSEANFWRYVDTYSDPDQSKIGDMFGWLSNELRGFPGSLNVSSKVQPRDNNQRPLIVVDPGDHPLALAQRQGISFERALKIAHDYL